MFVTLRMFELALHGWDIRSSLDSRAGMSAESLPQVMEQITNAGPRLVRPAFSVASPSRYRFDLSGPVSGRHDIVVEDGVARLERGSSAIPGGQVSCEAQTFALLMTGRVTFNSAVSDGRLAVSEGSQFPTDFNEWFTGVLRPREG